MFVSRPIFQQLESLSRQYFNLNYTITIDFLFYVFDSFSYQEKVNILKACPLLKDQKAQDKKENENDQSEVFSEEIKISIHPLLEDRIINLILECDKLQTASDGVEFLLFVLTLIDEDLLSDLIIQYSIETISVSDYSYLEPTVSDKGYSGPDPSHIIPNLPDKGTYQVIPAVM